MHDITALLGDLEGIPYSTNLSQVRAKSRDMTLSFSPILKQDLQGKSAEVVVTPRSQAEVIRVVAACARHRIPLLPRGAGTGNFGQAIPLFGGVILDMTALKRVLWVKGRRVRAEAGAILESLDTAAKAAGGELRIHPSTLRTATVGGFVGGGHAGIGAVTYGILRDPGNILGLKVLSVEEEPQIHEIRGRQVNWVHHAYGTNGIILEVELPLAPAQEWLEVILCFEDFMDGARFAVALGQADGIAKKVISLCEWPVPSYFKPLAAYILAHRTTVLTLVAAENEEALRWLAEDHRGQITYCKAAGLGEFGPLYEYTWGHTGLYAIKAGIALSYALGLFPPHDLIGSIERVWRRFQSLGPLCLEMKRMDGRGVMAQGSPIFNFVSNEHMIQVIRDMEAEGVHVRNSHTYLIEESGFKTVDPEEQAFKQRMDPYNLLNPGKLSTASPKDSASKAGLELEVTGWKA
ncbi:FAD-binding oxidoreductase [Synechococcus sp. Nb3U1]|uniref:FAD-binding oxidoreductase n=1 Tax=Synechococcus sp. Nb3U1 TaxID=1914529 RepID=UPI001F456E0D|nr:FAD-binding oxidoreductase [Synechococcus sp. Nb3U1]MCF2970449.1 FAD-binding oxidoreductase [Synechococcus sp. Nb3U1]